MLVALLSVAGVAGCNDYRSFTWGDGVSWQQARTRSLDHQSAGSRRGSSGTSRHVVMPGDTVSELAEAYRVPTTHLAAANGLGAPYRIYVGQVLEIPAGETPAGTVRTASRASPQPSAPRPVVAVSTPARATPTAQGGRVHVVSTGETVTSIARKYGYRTGDVLAINRAIDPNRLAIGTPVRLPASQVRNVHTATARVAPPVARHSAPVIAKTETVTTPAAGAPTATVPAATMTVTALPEPRPRKQPPSAVRSTPPALSGSGFVWPVEGEIISAFGRQPDGLQNDGNNVRAPGGATVLAVENGVVVYAGSDIPAFGRMLMIRHAGDYLSAYAHNATLLVAEGDEVRRGQPIAKVGATGDVLEPQLHFELRKGRDAVDPVRHLRGGNLQVAQKS